MIWHYTTIDHLKDIVTDGVLNVTAVGVKAREKPAVWFSTQQDWESTANKAISFDGISYHTATPEEMDTTCGRARIGVAEETAPHDWKAFKRLSGIRAINAKALYQTALGQGAKPNDWRVSFETVATHKWLRVEVFEDGKWQDYQS